MGFRELQRHLRSGFGGEKTALTVENEAYALDILEDKSDPVARD